MAMENSSVSGIEDLEEKLSMIRELNDRSKYLVKPVILLGLLLIEDARYDEAEFYLTEVKNWHDAYSALDLIPLVELHLARIQYLEARYPDAAAAFTAWLSSYETEPLVDTDLKAGAYCYLGQSYMKLKDNARALQAFTKLKQEYSETAFFDCCGLEVEELIETCEQNR
jgi:tetratricopeptide (TPR) repeat protein